MNTVVHVVVQMLLTCTLQSLCQFIFMFLLWIWSTHDMKVLTGYWEENCSIWVLHSDKMSHQWKLFHLVDFDRNVVCSPGELIPFELFSRTVCHHTMRTGSTWLIQKWKGLFFRKKIFFQFKFFLLPYVGCEEKPSDWQILLWFCASKFLVMVVWISCSQKDLVNLPFFFRSFKLCTRKEYHLLHTCLQQFTCIATVKFFRFLPSFQINLYKAFHWNTFPQMKQRSNSWGLRCENNREE